MNTHPSLFFPPFDAHASPNTGKRWTDYLERFDIFLAAMVIDDSKRHRALLLHFMGEETYQIFKTLTDTGEANDLLTKYFQPKKNIEFQKHAFRQTGNKGTGKKGKPWMSITPDFVKSKATLFQDAIQNVSVVKLSENLTLHWRTC